MIQNNDTISRQAAIDAFMTATSDGDKFDWCKCVLKQVPSAQPEIIRCKDCKHRDPEDKKCDCGHDIQWQLPRQDDWYCADAKRRTE